MVRNFLVITINLVIRVTVLPRAVTILARNDLFFRASSVFPWPILAFHPGIATENVLGFVEKL